MKTPAVIFDIDGTIADISHRLHMLKGDKTDWDAFNAACVDDKPKQDIINLLIMYGSQGLKILLVTGRSCQASEETMQWLEKNNVPFHFLFMRPRKDFRSDWEVKEHMLNRKILPQYDIEMVVDDRDRVVQMWRDNGLTCLQCQKGDY